MRTILKVLWTIQVILMVLTGSLLSLANAWTGLVLPLIILILIIMVITYKMEEKDEARNKSSEVV